MATNGKDSIPDELDKNEDDNTPTSRNPYSMTDPPPIVEHRQIYEAIGFHVNRMDTRIQVYMQIQRDIRLARTTIGEKIFERLENNARDEAKDVAVIADAFGGAKDRAKKVP